MKNIIKLVVTVIAVTIISCSQQIDYDYTQEIKDAQAYEMPEYILDMNDYNLVNPYDAVYESFAWVLNNIDYHYEYGQDSWQTPTQTLSLGRGDCEDQIILTLYFYYTITGDLEMMEMLILETMYDYHAVIYDKIQERYIGLIGDEKKTSSGGYVIKHKIDMATAFKMAEYIR